MEKKLNITPLPCICALAGGKLKNPPAVQKTCLSSVCTGLENHFTKKTPKIEKVENMKNFERPQKRFLKMPKSSSKTLGTKKAVGTPVHNRLKTAINPFRKTAYDKYI